MTWSIDDLLRLQALEQSGVDFSVVETQLKVGQSAGLNEADKDWIRRKRIDLIQVVNLRTEWKAIGGF